MRVLNRSTVDLNSFTCGKGNAGNHNAEAQKRVALPLLHGRGEPR